MHAQFLWKMATNQKISHWSGIERRQLQSQTMPWIVRDLVHESHSQSALHFLRFHIGRLCSCLCQLKQSFWQSMVHHGGYNFY